MKFRFLLLAVVAMFLERAEAVELCYTMSGVLGSMQVRKIRHPFPLEVPSCVPAVDSCKSTDDLGRLCEIQRIVPLTYGTCVLLTGQDHVTGASEHATIACQPLPVYPQP